MLPRIWDTQFKSHFCINSFQPRSQGILVWTPLALCCWDVTFCMMEHFLDPGGPSTGKVPQTLCYSIYSFPWWKFSHFARWKFLSPFQQERCAVLSCRIPCTPLCDSSPLFEWLCFAKKISVSCIKKAANHRDVFCHLAFPTHPEARECLALSWECIPAWLVAGCLHEELLALVQKVLLLLRCAEIRPEEKHMYWSVM